MKDQQAKIPGTLKKPIKEKTFQKRFLKCIVQSADRDWFASQFELKDGKYFIRGINKSDEKRLKQLYGVIKTNRKGPVRLGPLALAGIVIGGLIVFFAIFANPLLERAMELGLEAIFEAKSDVDRLRISLIDFSINIDKITVANRDKPMTNLFQMGKKEPGSKYGIRIKLKPEAVLRGKIYIEEISANELRFGTARTVSGALPNYTPRSQRAKQKSDEPPLVDLQNFDAMGLLNREFDKLHTPKLYDEAIDAYHESAEKWKGQVDLAKARTEELKTAAQPIIHFNVPNVDVRNVESVRQAVNDVNAMINNVNTMITTVQTAANDAANMVASIEDDINTVRNLEQSARNAITDDINHLKSYIDLNSGAAFAALEPSIREVLSDTGEVYFDYGLRALEVLEKVKAMAEAMPKTEKPKKQPKVVFKGRDVIYPTRAYPKFYLGIVASDFTIQPWNWAFDMRNISSNPDISRGPVTLKLAVKEESGSLERQVAFNGSADFTSAATDRFGAVVSGSGFPVNLGSALARTGINGFKSEAEFSVNFTGHTGGGFTGGGDVMLSSAMLVDPVGTIAQALDTAIRQAGNVNLGIQYDHYTDRNDEFHLTTNIAELMAQALRRIVEEYAKKAMDEIERVLREKINQYIDGRFVSKEELDVLFALARGDKAAMDELKNILNNKKAELEQKLREYTNQVKDAADQAVQQVKEEVTQQVEQAKEEAAQQAQQALDDIMHGQQPTLQAPTLPSAPSVPNVPLPNLPSVPGLPRR
ncbi:MAG: hypothetical protein FWG46_08120 [Treponema sp.]|nr:hypothetical protein [Treponema sp.]